MKIESTGKVDEQGVEFESIQAKIDSGKIGKLFNLLSGLYSDVLGSCIREYTSNCFDSHIEAGVDDPVVIKVVESQNAGDKYIEFHDVGVGLSPSRVQNIFMNYLSSTKEDTDDLIGGWGLGSKSGLAYQDGFEIKTRFNGIEYVYILRKSANGLPTLDKIIDIPTTERNGTIIKLKLKEEDKHRIVDKIIKSVYYFDNVFIDTGNKQTDATINNYEIIEGKTFKLRRGHLSSSTMDSWIHICLGKVYYPLNISLIPGFDMSSHIGSVGLKFNIGELPVTPSREGIEYTPEAIRRISTRLTEFTAELNELTESHTKDYFRIKDLIDHNPYNLELVSGLTLNLSEFSLLGINGIKSTYKGIEVDSKHIRGICMGYKNFSLSNITKTLSTSLTDRGTIVSYSYHFIHTAIILDKPELPKTKFNNLRAQELCTQRGLSFYRIRYQRIIPFATLDVWKHYRSFVKTLANHQDLTKELRLGIFKYWKDQIETVIKTETIKWSECEASPEWIAEYKARNVVKKTQDLTKVSGEFITVAGPKTLLTIEHFKNAKLTVLVNSRESDLYNFLENSVRGFRHRHKELSTLKVGTNIIFGKVTLEDQKRLQKAGVEFKTFQDYMETIPKSILADLKAYAVQERIKAIAEKNVQLQSAFADFERMTKTYFTEEFGAVTSFISDMETKLPEDALEFMLALLKKQKIQIDIEEYEPIFKVFEKIVTELPITLLVPTDLPDEECQIVANMLKKAHIRLNKRFYNLTEGIDAINSNESSVEVTEEVVETVTE